MPWNNGSFTRSNSQFNGNSVWQDDRNANFDIEAARHDAHDQDLAEGINACMKRDGTTPMVGPLDMGGKTITNLSQAQLGSDLPTLGQTIQSVDFENYVLSLRRSDAPDLVVDLSAVDGNPGNGRVFGVDTVADMTSAAYLAVGHTVRTAGYYTAGDGGGNVYQVVAAGTGTADGGAYIDHASNPVQFQALFSNGAIHPKQFGAVGDGTTDNRDVLIALYSYASASGLPIVDYSEATYRYAGDITAVGSIRIEGNATFFGDGATTIFQGELTEVGYIAAAAAEGEQLFTASSVTGLAENDLLILHDFTDYSYSPHRANYYNGEFVRVLSVSGSDVSLQSSLLASYAGASTDKIYKLTPAKVEIEGVSFTGGNFYTLRIRYADAPRVAPRVISNTSNNASAVAALAFDKCYNVRVEGGRYERPYVSGADACYGISFLNCQRALVRGADSFGGRHAVSTGGDAIAGAVPNRFIFIEDCVLANDPASDAYCADFHGNTLDSHYRGCEIYGRVGLAGENVSAIRCTVWSEEDNIRAPLMYQELVGGDLVFEDCRVYLGDGSTASSIVNNSSSSITANISKPYRVIVRGLSVSLNSAVTGLVNAFENSGQANSWILDDFTISGDDSGLTRLLTYTLSGSGVEPDLVEVTRPRTAVDVALTPIVRSAATLADTRIRLYPSSGSNANGTYRRMEDGTMICTFTYSAASTAISSAFLGGFRTGALVWTYPLAFIDEPTFNGVPSNGSALAITESSGTESSVSFFMTAVTSQASATREAKLTAVGHWGVA